MGAWAALPGAVDLEDEPQGEGMLDRRGRVHHSFEFLPKFSKMSSRLKFWRAERCTSGISHTHIRTPNKEKR